MTKISLEDNDKCFACGMQNLEGLRIVWTIDGTKMSGQFTPGEKYQGWKGIVHGGIIATLLDESMTRLVCHAYNHAVTAEMTVRYVMPALIDSTLFICGDIVSKQKRIVHLKSTIHDSTHKLIAHATGKAMILN
jgi:uncharacterized protein (TIGR00369 family)